MILSDEIDDQLVFETTLNFSHGDDERSKVKGKNFYISEIETSTIVDRFNTRLNMGQFGEKSVKGDGYCGYHAFVKAVRMMHGNNYPIDNRTIWSYFESVEGLDKRGGYWLTSNQVSELGTLLGLNCFVIEMHENADSWVMKPPAVMLRGSSSIFLKLKRGHFTVLVPKGDLLVDYYGKIYSSSNNTGALIDTRSFLGSKSKVNIVGMKIKPKVRDNNPECLVPLETMNVRILKSSWVMFSIDSLFYLDPELYTIRVFERNPSSSESEMSQWDMFSNISQGKEDDRAEEIPIKSEKFHGQDKEEETEFQRAFNKLHTAQKMEDQARKGVNRLKEMAYDQFELHDLGDKYRLKDKVTDRWADIDDEAIDLNAGDDRVNLRHSDHCCYKPAAFNLENCANMTAVLRSFKGTSPKSLCLSNALEWSTSVVIALGKLQQLDEHQMTFIQAQNHFRHDVFSYHYHKSLHRAIEFGTDANWSSVDERMDDKTTPDYILQVRENGVDKVVVNEVTVVNKRITAVFNKGITINDSKYKVELQRLRQLGYEVEYNTVILSLSDDFDTNVQQFPHEIPTDDLESIKHLYNTSKNVDQGCYSSMFVGTSDKTYPTFQKWNEKLGKYDPWKMISVNYDKDRIQELKILIKQVSESRWAKKIDFFHIITRQNGSLYLSPTTKENCSSHKVNMKLSVKNEDAIIANACQYVKCFRGKLERFVPSSRDKEERFELKVQHGKAMVDFAQADEKYKGKLVKSRDDLFPETMPKQFCDELRVSMSKMPGGKSLIKKLDKDSIKEALVKMESEIDELNRPGFRKHGVTVMNDPRRTFRALADPLRLEDNKELSPCNFNETDLGGSMDRLYSRFLFEGRRFGVSDPGRIGVSRDEWSKTKIREMYAELDNQKSIILGEASKGKNKKEKDKLIKSNKIFRREYKSSERIRVIKSTIKTLNSNLLGKGDISIRNNCIMINQKDRDIIKQERDWKKSSGEYKLFCGKAVSKDLELICEGILEPKNGGYKWTLPLNDRSKDNQFFDKLKSEAISSLISSLSSIQGSVGLSSCVLLSRLAYTLMILSNTSHSSEYVIMDCLGFRNVLLQVQGGAKMSKTNKSRPFQLLYPCVNETFKWNCTKNENQVVINGTLYEKTPWMFLHSRELTDMAAFPYKLLSMLSVSSESQGHETARQTISLSTVLMLSNRRKTEVMLHNLRYIMANATAIYSDIVKMLPTFGGENFTMLDACIRQGILDHFENYYNSVNSAIKTNKPFNQKLFLKNDITHPFMSRKMTGAIDFTFQIYCSYSMTKAPYEDLNESLSNMKSILEIHDEFKNLSFQPTLECQISDIIKNQGNDFTYDKRACYLAGKLCESELIKNNASGQLGRIWESIKGKSVDTMANNKGLRGLVQEITGKTSSSWFGNKGYYVIYSKLYEDKENFSRMLLDMEEAGENKKKQKKVVSKYNKTFESERSNDFKQMKFSMANKVQKGGGREIYVMDYDTKLHQYPLEKFMSEVCKQLQDEMISVPSNVRSSRIHSRVFDVKSDNEIYYLTMDCRKWAPKSNFYKYIWFLQGMGNSIPSDFIEDCSNFLLNYGSKKLYWRSELVEKFMSNKGNIKYENYFKKDSTGSYIEMNYSFMMGIFNYLSSALHAGGAKLFNYYLQESGFNPEDVNMTVAAHSDDSAAVLTIKKGINVEEILTIYSCVQRCLNHLMQPKKCAVGKNYYEFLSILYINKSLLPLLPKFVQNVSLNPSGYGPCGDMMQIVSKTTELLNNGCSIKVAYQIQRILGCMVESFYHSTNNHTERTRFNPSVGGTPDCLPHIYLMFGSSADQVREMLYNRRNFDIVRTFLHDLFGAEESLPMPTLSFSRIASNNRKYRDWVDHLQLPDLSMDEQWFFANHRSHNSLRNVLWFRAKLTAPKFEDALQDFSDDKKFMDNIRIASRATCNLDDISGFYTRNMGNKLTRGRITYRLALQLINNKSRYRNCASVTMLESLNKRCKKYFLATGESRNMGRISRAEFTLKPVKIGTTEFNDMDLEVDPMTVAVEICNPKEIKWLYQSKSYTHKHKEIKKYLSNNKIPLKIREIYQFLLSAKKLKNKSIYTYSSLPSGERELSNEPGLNKFLQYGWTPREVLMIQFQSISESIPVVNTNVSIDTVISMLSTDIARACSNLNISQTDVRCKKDIKSTHSGENIVRILDKNNLTGISWFKVLNTTRNTLFDLNNLKMYGLWLQQQVNRGDKQFTGTGNFLTNINGFRFQIELRGALIYRITTNQVIQTKTFDDDESTFLISLFNEFGVYSTPELDTPESSNYYLGMSKDNRVGIFPSHEISRGYKIELGQISTLDKSEATYKHSASAHYVSIRNRTYGLVTYDKLLFNQNSINVSDYFEYTGPDENKMKRLFLDVYSRNCARPEEANKASMEDVIKDENFLSSLNNLNLKDFREKLWSGIAEENASLGFLGQLIGKDSEFYKLIMYMGTEKQYKMVMLKHLISTDRDVRPILKYYDKEEVSELMAKVKSEKEKMSTALTVLSNVRNVSNFARLTYIPLLSAPKDSYELLAYRAHSFLYDLCNTILHVIRKNQSIIDGLLLWSDLYGKDIGTLTPQTMVDSMISVNYLSDEKLNVEDGHAYSTAPLLNMMECITTILTDSTGLALEFMEFTDSNSLSMFPCQYTFINHWVISCHNAWMTCINYADVAKRHYGSRKQADINFEFELDTNYKMDNKKIRLIMKTKRLIFNDLYNFRSSLLEGKPAIGGPYQSSSRDVRGFGNRTAFYKQEEIDNAGFVYYPVRARRMWGGIQDIIGNGRKTVMTPCAQLMPSSYRVYLVKVSKRKVPVLLYMPDRISANDYYEINLDSYNYLVRRYETICNDTIIEEGELAPRGKATSFAIKADLIGSGERRLRELDIEEWISNHKNAIYQTLIDRILALNPNLSQDLIQNIYDLYIEKRIGKLKMDSTRSIIDIISPFMNKFNKRKADNLLSNLHSSGLPEEDVTNCFIDNNLIMEAYTETVESYNATTTIDLTKSLKTAMTAVLQEGEEERGRKEEEAVHKEVTTTMTNNRRKLTKLAAQGADFGTEIAELEKIFGVFCADVLLDSLRLTEEEKMKMEMILSGARRVIESMSPIDEMQKRAYNNSLKMISIAEQALPEDCSENPEHSVAEFIELMMSRMTKLAITVKKKCSA